MKVIATLLLFTCMQYCVKAQTYTDYQFHGDYVDMYDNSGNKIKINDHTLLEGNSILNKEWATGSVVFNNGMQQTGMQLQFDVKDNAFHFKQNGSVYAFANIVRTCKMTYQENDVHFTVLFRSGYPGADGDSTNLLYQVIAEGPNFQFLKLLICTIEDQYSYGSAPKESYSIKEENYIYVVQKNQLIKIKENQKSVENALADYASQVQKFVAGKNVKLNNDEQITGLINTLNSVN